MAALADGGNRGEDDDDGGGGNDGGSSNDDVGGDGGRSINRVIGSATVTTAAVERLRLIIGNSSWIQTMITDRCSRCITRLNDNMKRGN